jgi:hypothetical protein
MICNAFVYNPNYKSKFFGFEIMTLREIWLSGGGTEIIHIRNSEEYLAEYDDTDEIFYRVYGLYDKEEGSAPKYPTQYYAMGDFYDVKDAKKFLEDLTGSNVWLNKL